MPRPAQPTPGSGPPDSTHIVPPNPGLRTALELDVIALFPQGVQHRLLVQPVEQ